MTHFQNKKIETIKSRLLNAMHFLVHLVNSNQIKVVLEKNY